jgi:hypothetical protein
LPGRPEVGDWLRRAIVEGEKGVKNGNRNITRSGKLRVDQSSGCNYNKGKGWKFTYEFFS